jgi:hypothetical protein
MAAEEVTVVKSQNRRSTGSLRNGLVWERGRFFIACSFYHGLPPKLATEKPGSRLP